MKLEKAVDHSGQREASLKRDGEHGEKPQVFLFLRCPSSGRLRAVRRAAVVKQSFSG
ncbi:hypothetical protein [Propionivibrio sp.]|uniref:hypothetical protein n=1 Tax=Propionivibrio sp. TaxID=2212460 RepID=UPI003BF2E453